MSNKRPGEENLSPIEEVIHDWAEMTPLQILFIMLFFGVFGFFIAFCGAWFWLLQHPDILFFLTPTPSPFPF